MKEMLKIGFGLELTAGLHVFAGKTDCDFSDFLVELAADITEDTNGIINHYDFKGKYSLQRIREITGHTESDLGIKYILHSNDTTVEDLYEGIVCIRQLKMSDEELLNHPTVILLDSATIMQYVDDTEEDEKYDNGIDFTRLRKARACSALFKRIHPMLKEANIVMLVVTDIEDYPRSTAPQFISEKAFLHVGETLPGTSTIIFRADSVFRFENVDEVTKELTVLKRPGNEPTGQSIKIIEDMEQDTVYFTKNE